MDERRPEIHRFCITHRLPLLPRGWYDDCISLDDFQCDSPFHIRNLDPFWHDARPVAYGAAGSYVIPQAIEKLRTIPDMIEISSFRKRILPRPLGSESKTYRTMRELGERDLKADAELGFALLAGELQFLVAQPLYFKNTILGQYSHHHRKNDLLEYASLASELGVLDPNSADDFLSSKFFVPGGAELGTYPAEWLSRTLSDIEVVGREYLTRNRNRIQNYDSYQIRVVGFLSERLGSYLLICELMRRYSGRMPADIFGHMSTVIDGHSGYTMGRTDDSAKRAPRSLLKGVRVR